MEHCALIDDAKSNSVVCPICGASVKYGSLERIIEISIQTPPRQSTSGSVVCPNGHSFKPEAGILIVRREEGGLRIDYAPEQNTTVKVTAPI